MISIIIPNYNSAQYLERAIESVLAQTFTDYEIIIVDDGSTDNSQKVVAKYASQVSCIRQENQGLAGARNTGIRAAKGDLIGLLDTDDEWCPEYLEQMVALSKQYPLASVYYCMAQCMDVDGRDLPQIVGGPAVVPSLLRDKLLRANFIIPSTVTFRRQPIIEAGYFDANLRFCEDWDLWLRLLPAQEIVGSNQKLVRYRIHGSSLSTNVFGNHDGAKKVIQKHFGSEDEPIASWSSEKRRAYGGLYRYYLLTSVQRQGEWQTGSQHLRKALEIDPTLAVDLDMFYDLTLGSQPSGYRGSTQNVDWRHNAIEVENLLDSAFSRQPLLATAIRRLAYGTANYAIGLIAYNIGDRKFCRQYLVKALSFRPQLWYDRRLSGNFMKSFLNPSFIRRLKLLTLYVKGGNSTHEYSIKSTR